MMIKLTKEQRELLGKQGWVQIGNKILTKRLEDNVVEIITIRPRERIRQLISLTKQSLKPNIKYGQFADIMTTIALLEKELDLYETNNE